MTILSKILNGSLFGDARDTINASLLIPFAKLVVIGDSIAFNGVPNWPSNLNLGPGVTVDNSLSVQGAIATDIPSQLPNGTFDGFISTLRSNIVVFSRATNDITNGTTPQTIYNTYTTLIPQAKLAGMFVGLATCTPKAGNYASSIATYNALVRANTAGADFILDIAADPILGDLAAPGNPLVYVDGLHPTQEGVNRYATLAAATIRPWATIPQPRSAELRKLTASNNTPTKAVLFSFTVNNLTFGSTLTASSPDGTTFTVSGTTVTGTFAVAGSPVITLTETLAGKANSPRVTAIAFVVTNAATPAHIAKYAAATSGDTPARFASLGSPSMVDYTTGDSVSYAVGDVQGVGTNGGPSTGNNSGIVPDAVLIDARYTTGPLNFAVTGLDNTKRYSIEIVGAISSAIGYTSQTDYTIGGVIKTLNTLNNTSNSVVFGNLSPTGGQIGVTWAVTSGYQLGIINAVIVTEYS